jgi:ferredoxin
MRFARRPRINWLLLTGRERCNRCGLCGVNNPQLFHVANHVWAFYVPPEQHRQILCASCWDWLTNAIDGAEYWRAHWEPGPLWAPVSRWRASRPAIRWQPPPSPRQRHNWCGLCSAKNPALFDVPNEVWLHYVGHEQRHQIVCMGCWHWLTNVIDGSAFEQEHGGAVSLWSREFRRRHGIPPDVPSPFDDTTEAS